MPCILYKIIFNALYILQNHNHVRKAYLISLKKKLWMGMKNYKPLLAMFYINLKQIKLPYNKAFLGVSRISKSEIEFHKIDEFHPTYA